LSLTLESVDMVALMNEVALPFIETATKHTILVEGLQSCPAVKGDRMRLSQVAKNLLSNAVKYSPEGGTVTIRADLMPSLLHISIADQGIGMTPEQQQHLFEKFYRADTSNTAINGTGLGLAISKLIVELHGGYIWAESTPGEGTIFHFTVPLAAETSTEAKLA
jgi:signal transduction histidine kinase